MSTMTFMIACAKHPSNGVIDCEQCEDMHESKELFQSLMKDAAEKGFVTTLAFNGERQ
jgi:hypothetical protein